MRKLEVVVGVLVLAVLLPVGVAAQGVLGDKDNEGPLLAWTPPLPCEGVFTDVPCGSQFDTWVEQFARDGITGGCAAGKYCPEGTVTRRQMAVLMERAMRGASGWPPHTTLVFHHPAAEANSDVNSGTELLSLVAAIPSSGNEMPSASNPWLVKVGPGIYDLGSGWLTLPAYTALEGAGQDITVINASRSPDFTHGTVNLNDHGRLSRLTINNNNTIDSEYAIAAYVYSGSASLEHVTLNASISVTNIGKVWGLRSAASTSFSMVDCEVTVQGGQYAWGIAAFTSSDRPRLTNVHVHVRGYGSSSPISLAHGFSGYETSPVISNSSFSVTDGEIVTGIELWKGDQVDIFDSSIDVSSGHAVSLGEIDGVFDGTRITSGGVGIVTGETGNVSIRHSYIRAMYDWLGNLTDAEHTVKVVNSQLIGGTHGSGTTICLGNTTDSAFLANTCP